MTQKFNETLATKELYGIDWLKVVVRVKHNRESLTSGMRIDIQSLGGEYDFDNSIESYKSKWLSTSYDNRLQVKSLKEDQLQIEGNFYKWLNGHNIKGSSDLITLVYDVVKSIAGVEATEEQLLAIKKGLFKVYTVDVNKPLLFACKSDALKYLETMKHCASYPYKERTIKDNGVYFGKESKRWLIKYYHKGNEIKANHNYQTNLTEDLKALADVMIRCEMRIKWQQLKDWDLLTGDKWNSETVVKLIDDAHKKLKMPKHLVKKELPKRYLKFISCIEAGTVAELYTSNTIKKMKSDLIREHGYYV